ncbi:MAG TPA: ABC transporter permease [Candidatus Limnocylindrales bacterium]|nr:ABC transporter permease [Candidatus Limnocylindrales bacterium]
MNTVLIAADFRALVAAARKELRTIRRYPTSFIGQVFWPVLLPAVWVLMGQAYSGNGDPQAMDAFASRSGTTGVTLFIFVGYAMYMWLSSLLWGPGTSLRREQMTGSLEAVFLTPVSRLVPLFGPTLTNVVWTVFQLVVMGIAVWLLFGVVLPLGGVLLTFLVVLAGLPAMYAMGSLFGAAVLRFGEIGPAVQFVRGALSLLCGITFPIVMLPAWAQATSATMPPTHLVAAIREALLHGATPLDLAPTAGILLVLAIVFGAFAIVLFRILEASARRTGMLGRY